MSVDSAKQKTMKTACRDCPADVGADNAHCHGAVIVHIGQRPECTEPDCSMPEVAHTYVIDCFAVGCGCGDARAGQPIGSAVSIFSSAS